MEDFQLSKSRLLGTYLDMIRPLYSYSAKRSQQMVFENPSLWSGSWTSVQSKIDKWSAKSASLPKGSPPKSSFWPTSAFVIQSFNRRHISAKYLISISLKGIGYLRNQETETKILTFGQSYQIPDRFAAKPDHACSRMERHYACSERKSLIDKRNKTNASDSLCWSRNRSGIRIRSMNIGMWMLHYIFRLRLGRRTCWRR